MQFDFDSCLAAGVLILEDWQYRSSSPYPERHKELCLSSLLSRHRAVPVVSIPRISERERGRFLTLRSLVTTVRGEEVTAGLQQWTRSKLRVDCGQFACVSVNRSSSVYLNEDSQHSRDVQISTEELTYSQSGLYRLARTETRQQSVNIRCRGQLDLSLSSLFCEDVPEFWHQEYLHNYSCCTDTRHPVLSPPGCQGKEVVSWGDWSRWGEGERVLAGGKEETVSRRYRLATHLQCVSVMVQTR